MTRAGSTNIIDKMRADKGITVELEKKRIRLEEDNKQNLSEYDQKVKQMLAGEKVDVQELSKLDQGIERGNQYKQEINQLAESLTGELNELGQFFGDMAQYKGLTERVLGKIGLTKLADRKRMARVKSCDVKQNLETILDYGTHMVSKLYEATLENMECQAKIDTTIRYTAKKLEENQPIYEKYRSERESLERDLNSLQQKIDKSEAREAAALVSQRAELTAKLADVKANEDNYFTIVNKAKEALPIQNVHYKSYSDIVAALIVMKTGLEQDIENVTQIYLAVPVAIKTALGTKAASIYDQGMKYATGVSTEAVLAATAGILDEVVTRAERPLIEPDKLEGYRKRMAETRANYELRSNAIKATHAQPSAVN